MELPNPGDAEFKQKCRDKLAQLKEEGTTIVLVTHALKMVQQLCERVFWIEDHAVKMLSTPAEVVEAFEEKVTTGQTVAQGR